MSKKRHNNRAANTSTKQWPDESKFVYGNHDTEVRVLPLGVLNIEPGYQRRLNMHWAQWIADHFKPHLVEILQVSYRDGKYWVFDGQHTMTALKIKFHNDNLPVTCKIYRGLTKEDEAQLFYDFNTATRKISSEAMIKAKNAAGDKEVRNFIFRTRDAGFIIDPDKTISCKYGIQAVTNALKCYETIGKENYSRMLNLIYATWDGERWAVSKNMLNAMAILVNVYGDKLDGSRFSKKLKTISQNNLVKKANDNRKEGRKVSVAYAMALVDFYNSGLGKERRLKNALLLDE